jgi:tetratricopeptide (TPR) repeat protein
MSRTSQIRVRTNRTSWAGKILLGLASVAFALLGVGLVEGALRFAGLGAPDASQHSRLAYQKIYFPILVHDETPDGHSVLRTNDPRLPFQEIPDPKPEGTLRIITFGGSATAGLGYSPNVSFSHHLERMLKKSHPDRTVEVINLGIVAFASSQVALLVEEAVDHYEPDALIVYSGNNEFLEIHAQKYAEANASVISTLRDHLADTHSFRLIRRLLRGTPEATALQDPKLSQENLRQMQGRVMMDIQLDPDEVDTVVDNYQANLKQISDAASRTNTPLLLMTVASNWEWLDRAGLSKGWLQETVPGSDTDSEAGLLLARGKIDYKIAESDPSTRSEWLFKRAVINQRLKNWEAAKRDYREAMNQDIRLRRALDPMADRVRKVAEDRDAVIVDTIELLSETTPHGIIGFSEFYDYVHFRPEGSIRVAGFLFDSLRDTGISQPDARFDSQHYVAEELQRAQTDGEDSTDLDRWAGFGPKRGSLADRDLWKYDQMILELDRRILEDPHDTDALIRRANAYYFQVDGADEAREHYETALKIDGEDPAVRANLERLKRQARP